MYLSKKNALINLDTLVLYLHFVCLCFINQKPYLFPVIVSLYVSCHWTNNALLIMRFHLTTDEVLPIKELRCYHWRLNEWNQIDNDMAILYCLQSVMHYHQKVYTYKNQTKCNWQIHRLIYMWRTIFININNPYFSD